MHRTIFAGLFAAALAVCAPSAAQAAPQYRAPTTHTTPAQAYREAAHGAGISVGQALARDVIYVFFDPQCPHCAAMWADAKPLLGDVRMVWIPVAFLDRMSAPQGAAILGARDPAAAIDAHETKVNQDDYGSMPAGVPPRLLNEVKSNTKLWIGLGGDVVPYVLYKNRRTGKAGVIAGEMPTAELRKHLGLP